MDVVPPSTQPAAKPVEKNIPAPEIAKPNPRTPADNVANRNVVAAIAASVLIVLGLAAMALFAYFKTNG